MSEIIGPAHTYGSSDAAVTLFKIVSRDRRLCAKVSRFLAQYNELGNQIAFAFTMPVETRNMLLRLHAKDALARIDESVVMRHHECKTFLRNVVIANKRDRQRMLHHKTKTTRAVIRLN